MDPVQSGGQWTPGPCFVLTRCNYANHVVNIKNLLEYNPSYVESLATNEFYYLDTSRNADRTEFTINNTGVTGGANVVKGRRAEYNKGFAVRKAILGDSETVRCEILLNRYSFFESLDNKLLPNTKIELNVELESDNNLICELEETIVELCSQDFNYLFQE